MNIEEYFENCVKENTYARKALILAVNAHRGQMDLVGEEYIKHVICVAKFVTEITKEDTVLAVAFLHDIVEDTHVTINDLNKIFPNEIVKSVHVLSKKKNVSYMEYIKQVKKDNNAKIVKLADLKHNQDISRFKREILTERELIRLKKYRWATEYLEN